MKEIAHALKSFFGVIVKTQTYRNGLYLLLTFPLGIAYGCFLMAGWFLGYGLVLGGRLFTPYDMLANIKILAIVTGGILVWCLVIISCGIPAWFEKRLANWLLGTSFRTASHQASSECNLRKRIRTYLSDPVTWKSVIFIALKFPLGILFFTVVIGLLSAATGSLLAPLAHLFGFKSFIIGPWRIDTWGETFIACATGIFAVPLALHLINGLAFACKWFAKVMLGSPSSSQEA